jgi:hypothetical protein
MGATEKSMTMHWDFGVAQARQTRAGFLILAITFLVGPACLVLGEPATSLAQALAPWVPAVGTLLASPPGAGVLAAQVVAVNVALAPLYVVLLAYRQNFAQRFRMGTRRLHWGPVQAVLISYLLLLPAVSGALLVVFLAPFPVPDVPLTWGERFLVAMLGSHLGLLILLPLAVTGLALLAYALVFFCWLPLSFLFNALRGDTE